MAKVSVVIPNYNHAPYLEQRIESVLSQTFQDFEIILMDDCSTDGSQGILERYRNHPKVSKLLINEGNSGSPFRQWAKGLAEARGEYLWIAESDDYADKALLEKLVSILEHHGQVGIAYCQSWRVDREGNRLFSGRKWYDAQWDYDHIHHGAEEVKEYFVQVCLIANASAALFRKSVYGQINQVYKQYKSVGDWQLWIELLLKSDIAFCAEHLNYFRALDTSVSFSSNTKWIGILERYKLLAFVKTHLTHLNTQKYDHQKKYLAGMWARLILSAQADNTLSNHWSLLKLAICVDRLIIPKLILLLVRIYPWKKKSASN